MTDGGVSVSELRLPEGARCLEIEDVLLAAVADDPEVPDPLVGQTQGHVTRGAMGRGRRRRRSRLADGPAPAGARTLGGGLPYLALQRSLQQGGDEATLEDDEDDDRGQEDEQ